jgi:hypothetical protein
MNAAAVKMNFRSVLVVLGSSFFVLSSAVMLPSCGEDTPTNPDPLPPTMVTDTFSGSINKNGAASHNFRALAAGTVTSTLTAVGPDAVGADGTALVVGFGLGVWSGTTCTISQGTAQDRAVQSSVLYANVNAPGELCVRVYDVGNVTDSVDYTVTVVHP